jgi:hypothetical protein
MKTYNIVLFFPNQAPFPPYSDEKWRARHDDLISYFPKNVRFYLVKDETKYIWNDRFLPDFIRSWTDWITHSWEEIHTDLILWTNKNKNFTNIYYNPIKEICSDKRKIETLFPKHTLTSYNCESYSDVLKYWTKVSSNTKVLKPVFGSQGRWIIIWDIIPLEGEFTETFPYILQEFLDTSWGFYGEKWIHDFRTIIINGEITGSFLRIAKLWIMTANVNTGASSIDFGIWNIPPKVAQVIREIDNYLGKLYPERYYSIDIGVWKDWEIKVFELNSSPMLSTPSIRRALALHIIKNILKIS